MPDDGSEPCSNSPATFPIKIMGRREDGFAQAIVEVVLRHAPDFDPATHGDARPDGGQLPVASPAPSRAPSREQLDALYRELCGHPW